MPRAPANPDPLVEDFTPTEGHGAGLVYTISAFRNGQWVVKRGDRILHTAGSKLSGEWAGFGAAKYPSNRLQALAMREAKEWLKTVMQDIA